MQTLERVEETDIQSARDYVTKAYETVWKRNRHESEFLQAVKEIFDSLVPVLARHPKYIDHRILERIAEPERMIIFKVPWVDDQGNVQINRGFRVQFNSAIGPYKGGIRFHPSVNASIIKFLGFEQIFKNSLTGQPIGGGKGGADFDPKGKSDREIMSFTQSFMNELCKYMGPDTDIPAGDIGVGAREIGFMFGQYKKIRGRYDAGVLTGKGLEYGGSFTRKEATGYGLVYFVEEMLKDQGLSFKGSTVVVSGSGNVALYAMEKAAQFGAKVVACSDSDGYVYDKNGIHLDTVKRLKEFGNKRISEYVDEHPEACYFTGCSGIWSVPCEIALPCATQNEMDEKAAQVLIENGVKAIGEGANMPCSQEAARRFLDSGILFGPAKAANAGGVAVSALEMAQNSTRLRWTAEETDARLRGIMTDIYRKSVKSASEYGRAGYLTDGCNIAGFMKVADAMIAQGVV
ncbi:NADP-specific glutamate dehydrogenase [Bacillus swezeyi]|uniref:NADP-specific glutamate dehydrogenase n=1 Tax=Bacillus swezeyi TaxID=1925020 RepID=UPI003F8B5F52